MDADGDGYGDDASVILACDAPAGYVAIGGDCFDKNADAHPGQTSSFTNDRGDGSFDFDCDGVEAPALGKVDPDYCLCSGPLFADCSRTEGWAGVVPSCGAEGAFNRAKPRPISTCEPDVELVVQSCR